MQKLRLFYLMMVVCMTLQLSACATVGRSFPEAMVKDIEIGTTTKEEIRTMLGEPWRTGWEDGLETWTYGRYRYRAFKATESSDLVVRFEKNGIVNSYAYSTTNPEGVK